jgi:D-alanine transaminase
MEKEGLEFEQGDFSLDDMREAREAFLTSATSFVKPIIQVDGRPVGDGKVGPVARRLFALFARHVQGARNAA